MVSRAVRSTTRSTAPEPCCTAFKHAWAARLQRVGTIDSRATHPCLQIMPFHLFTDGAWQNGPGKRTGEAHEATYHRWGRRTQGHGPRAKGGGGNLDASNLAGRIKTRLPEGSGTSRTPDVAKNRPWNEISKFQRTRKARRSEIYRAVSEFVSVELKGNVEIMTF